MNKKTKLILIIAVAACVLALVIMGISRAAEKKQIEEDMNKNMEEMVAAATLAAKDRGLSCGYLRFDETDEQYERIVHVQIDGFGALKPHEMNLFYWDLSRHAEEYGSRMLAFEDDDIGNAMYIHDGDHVFRFDDYRMYKYTGTERESVADMEYKAYNEDGTPRAKKSSGSGNCQSCNGTGKQLVTWYSEGDHGEKSYTSYDCTACGGDGRK